jgi:FKBP-type peptidyl-prolyl cis-trans isomerase
VSNRATAGQQRTSARRAAKRAALARAAQERARARRRRQAAIGAAVAVLVVALSVVLVVTLGGGKKKPAASGQPGPSAASGPASAAASAPAAPAASLDPALAKKPTVNGAGAKPTKLVSKVLVQGTGAEVKAGQTISVNYVGVSMTTGAEFDSSWSRNQPASFAIGTGNVIKGWDEGLVGVKVGSRVQLDIPADLGYGASAAPGYPSGPLRFVVDILSAQ